jgi:hypothetical protein
LKGKPLPCILILWRKELPMSNYNDGLRGGRTRAC